MFGFASTKLLTLQQLMTCHEDLHGLHNLQHNHASLMCFLCVLLVTAAVVGMVLSCCTGLVQLQCMHSSMSVPRLCLGRYCW